MSSRVDRKRRQRQAKALANLLDKHALLPVGVLGAAQPDQDVIGVELCDGVRKGGQDAVITCNAAGLDADRAHVAEDGVKALV
ncbi:MAG: hypothetical protein LC790_18430, partial [Actinobacteria bacterium]|nr:hypothetical protein [Actinomycetota bacterium]